MTSAMLAWFAYCLVPLFGFGGSPSLQKNAELLILHCSSAKDTTPNHTGDDRGPGNANFINTLTAWRCNEMIWEVPGRTDRKYISSRTPAVSLTKTEISHSPLRMSNSRMSRCMCNRMRWRGFLWVCNVFYGSCRSCNFAEPPQRWSENIREHPTSAGLPLEFFSRFPRRGAGGPMSNSSISLESHANTTAFPYCLNGDYFRKHLALEIRNHHRKPTQRSKRGTCVPRLPWQLGEANLPWLRGSRWLPVLKSESKKWACQSFTSKKAVQSQCHSLVTVVTVGH